jgi:LytR cell envelope-related transcriptional attenuator/cell envelope-related transcriptional attenuator-like protein
VRPEFDPPDPTDEDLPPLKDWPPPEILARWEARKEAVRKRRAVRRRIIGLILVAALAVAGIVIAVRRGSGPPAKAKSAGGASRPPTVVWSVNISTGSFVSVISDPGALGPVALVIPDQTLVDLPGGPPTVGQSAGDPGLLLAAAQATLNRRLDHYLVTNDVDLSSLLDRIGPIDVQVEQPFVWAERTFGPGEERLTGGPVVAYLESADELDRTSRWEEVLTGILSARPNPRGWNGPLGLTDSARLVRSVLSAARDAAVLEIPTAPSEGGGLLADPDDVADFLKGHLGPAGPPLLRVIVLTANGRKGDVIVIATRLAALGYRVVASQEARSRLAQTQIVASDDSFLAKASQVQAILGVGSVYVAPDPSGVADITIVVGKDFKAG